ncbi:MAG TPA: hypothetical protein VNV17_17525, partial [Solirubrobacteraceae bacterium]|nr:hypothetical protein [Solirubrobacteraceae bacterium]
MATTSNPGDNTPSSTAKAASTTAKTTARKAASSSKSAARSTRTTARRSAAGTRSTARRTTSGSSTSTQPKTAVEQAQVLAERVILVPVGASLLARENLVSSVKGLATKYGTRTSVERELKRYERRGASARNRFE